jgi:hypothetical protein
MNRSCSPEMRPNHGLQGTLDKALLARLRFILCFSFPSARCGVVPRAPEPDR